MMPNADIAPIESEDEVIRLARNGRKVTVLFPGNPYAFSNGSQVADRLERAGIDFEAVPGPIVERPPPGMSGLPPTLAGPPPPHGLGPLAPGGAAGVRPPPAWGGD